MNKEYDSDLSKCKAGDWIWTTSNGWIEVSNVDRTGYPICTKGEDYTVDGEYRKSDKYPSAFITPPACFNPEPKPCKFKKGDRVLTKYDSERIGVRRYFSHMQGDDFCCFINGLDEWSAGGKTSLWQHCVKWEEGMDE